MYALKADKSVNGKSKYLESQLVMVFITLSGGLQDAYTYCIRGKVFANAQTGNIVLMAGNFFEGEFMKGLRYLIPLLVFASGILLADQIRVHMQNITIINPPQIIVLVEAVLLFITSFIPGNPNYDMLANALVSFCCAMQIQTFRKVNGYAYASTMCIGNIKNAMDALDKWLLSGSKDKKKEFLQYAFVIFVFAIGAGLGTVISGIWGIRTIILSSVLLFCAFLILLY